MHINWFKDENHLVYINGETQLAELERTLHFPGLADAANELRRHPTAEGFTIKGPKRTSGRLFVPDLTFGEHIEMGENILTEWPRKRRRKNMAVAGMSMHGFHP